MQNNIVVYSWGSNQKSQLGLPIRANRLPTAQEIRPLRNLEVCQVSCGHSHVFCVLSSGRMYGWGKTEDGVLTLTHGEVQEIPKPLEKIPFRIRDVACGKYHSIFVADDGSVFSVGNLRKKAMGIPSSVIDSLSPVRPQPQLLRTLTAVRIVQVSCGKSHSLARSHDGQVFAWGSGESGRLGLGNTSDRATPEKVTELSGRRARDIACGGHHSAILSDKGDLFTFGSGAFGQLGHGDTNNQLSPRIVNLPDGQAVIQVALGKNHTMILYQDGTVATCGRGNKGQLGHGLSIYSNNDKRTFSTIEPETIRRAKQVAAGHEFSAVLLHSGAVYTFGDNEHGQLGHSDGKNSSTPVRVAGISLGISFISCGATFMVAVGGALFQATKKPEVRRASDPAAQVSQPRSRSRSPLSPQEARAITTLSPPLYKAKDQQGQPEQDGAQSRDERRKSASQQGLSLLRHYRPRSGSNESDKQSPKSPQKERQQVKQQNYHEQQPQNVSPSAPPQTDEFVGKPQSVHLHDDVMAHPYLQQGHNPIQDQLPPRRYDSALRNILDEDDSCERQLHVLPGQGLRASMELIDFAPIVLAPRPTPIISPPPQNPFAVQPAEIPLSATPPQAYVYPSPKDRSSPLEYTPQAHAYSPQEYHPSIDSLYAYGSQQPSPLSSQGEWANTESKSPRASPSNHKPARERFALPS